MGEPIHTTTMVASRASVLVFVSAVLCAVCVISSDAAPIVDDVHAVVPEGEFLTKKKLASRSSGLKCAGQMMRGFVDASHPPSKFVHTHFLLKGTKATANTAQHRNTCLEMCERMAENGVAEKEWRGSACSVTTSGGCYYTDFTASSVHPDKDELAGTREWATIISCASTQVKALAKAIALTKQAHKAGEAKKANAVKKKAAKKLKKLERPNTKKASPKKPVKHVVKTAVKAAKKEAKAAKKEAKAAKKDLKHSKKVAKKAKPASKAPSKVLTEKK